MMDFLFLGVLLAQVPPLFSMQPFQTLCPPSFLQQALEKSLCLKLVFIFLSEGNFTCLVFFVM